MKLSLETDLKGSFSSWHFHSHLGAGKAAFLHARAVFLCQAHQSIVSGHSTAHLYMTGSQSHLCPLRTKDGLEVVHKQRVKVFTAGCTSVLGFHVRFFS